MISLLKVFLKANLWRDFVSSVPNFCTLKFDTEFTIICPYWRESIGRPRSKSCIVLVPFIDSCKIIGEGWWQSARMEIIHKYCIM